MTISLSGPYAGTCVGADGAAAVVVTTPQVIAGKLIGIYIKYAGDKPATTDVVITTKGTSPSIPALTLLTLTDKVTDGLFLVRVTPVGVTGVALAALTVLEPFPVHDQLVMTVAQANTDDVISMWLLVEN